MDYKISSISREWISKFFMSTINSDEEMSSSFPGEVSEDTSRVSSDLTSFHDFLKSLSKEGIHWADLSRGDNVMIRPSTGDLVLTDVGLFE